MLIVFVIILYRYRQAPVDSGFFVLYTPWERENVTYQYDNLEAMIIDLLLELSRRSGGSMDYLWIITANYAWKVK